MTTDSNARHPHLAAAEQRRYDRYRAVLDPMTEAEGEALAQVGVSQESIVAFGRHWEVHVLPDLVEALDDLIERARIAEMRDVADWIDENATTDCDEDDPGAVKAARISADLRRGADMHEQGLDEDAAIQRAAAEADGRITDDAGYAVWDDEAERAGEPV